MRNDVVERLQTETNAVLANLPESVRQGLSSPKSRDRLHAQLVLRTTHLSIGLANLLRDSPLLPSPWRMLVFVNTTTPLDPDTVATWLVERAAGIGASAAVADFASFTTAKNFAAREIIVPDNSCVRHARL